MKEQPLSARIKDRFLRFAEDMAYDIVGLPVALRYAFSGRKATEEKDPVRYLRAVYCENYWRRKNAFWHALLAIVMFPIGFVIYLTQFTMRNGSFVRTQTGKPVPSQMAEQVSLAFRHSMAPYWYYMFELYEDRRYPEASLYLQRYETKGHLYALLQPRNNDGMQDKAIFARRCRAANVMAAPVLLELVDGEVNDPEGGEVRAPRSDLFIKPRIGRGGRNAERWDFIAPSTWRNREHGEKDEKALLAHMAALSIERDYIVQPRLSNHADLSEVNNGALATVRVVTCRTETGSIEATDAAFRMAIGTNNTVDNFHAGGIAAPVDMRTGELGAASNMGLRPGVGWCRVHPNTGAAIEGRKLPLWPELIDLACRAHAAFPERIVVGWDIGILQDGPAIVEGNIKPDLDIHQRVARKPLGGGRLAELLAFNVRKALAGK